MSRASPAAASNEVQVIRLEGPPREAGLGDWLGLGVMLLMLLAMALFARRRSRQSEAGTTPRLLRIFYTAVIFAGSVTLWLVVEYFATPGASDDLLPLAAFVAFILTLVGLVLFGIADFWLGLFRPRRSRSWLVAAVAAFVLLVVSSVLIASWIQGSIETPLLVEMLQLIVLGAVAGLTWWTYLPALRGDVARTFD